MSLIVRKRRGETDEQLVRRFLRKQRNTNLMDEIRHPVHGTPECRNISKRSLKKAYKKDQAARRRKREAYQALKRQRKREARMKKMRR
tara:strand:+ start:115 stop:378 length:264 start_codon:yes stop_codon:yes gene_type:complete